MGTRLETEMKDLIAARRSRLISEAEFDAAAAYLAKHGGLPEKDIQHQPRYHIPAAPIPPAIKPKRRSKTGQLILLLLGLIYIGSREQVDPARSHANAATEVKHQKTQKQEVEEVRPVAKPVPKKVTVAATTPVLTPTYPEVSQNLRHKLCKAGIATLFSQEPSIIYTNDMRSSKGEIDQVGLFYRRPNDNTLWEYKCFTYENRVVWGAHDGRWRTHPLDEPVYFKLDKHLIHIQVHAGTDGSLVTARTYNVNKL